MAKILVPENVTRKVDNLGRVTLPKGLRDRMYLAEGDDLEIFTARLEGRDCICFSKPISAEDEIEEAIEILAKYGITVEERTDAV